MGIVSQYIDVCKSKERRWDFGPAPLMITPYQIHEAMYGMAHSMSPGEHYRRPSMTENQVNPLVDSCLFFGPRQSGKTRLLVDIVARAISSGKYREIYWFTVHGRSRGRGEYILDEICHTLMRTYNYDFEAPGGGNERYLRFRDSRPNIYLHLEDTSWVHPDGYIDHHSTPLVVFDDAYDIHYAAICNINVPGMHVIATGWSRGHIMSVADILYQIPEVAKCDINQVLGYQGYRKEMWYRPFECDIEFQSEWRSEGG